MKWGFTICVRNVRECAIQEQELNELLGLLTNTEKSMA
jgi:hypothetical protein